MKKMKEWEHRFIGVEEEEFDIHKTIQKQIPEHEEARVALNLLAELNRKSKRQHC
jgi:hypothetical protein